MDVLGSGLDRIGGGCVTNELIGGGGRAEDSNGGADDGGVAPSIKLVGRPGTMADE